MIVPALLSHTGPVVSTSTKPDVLAATAGARSQVGKLWEFDPTGAWAGVGEQLRWSPVFTSREWDRALLMARAMISGTRVGAGTTDQTHWSHRAQALLAPLLHAAAIGGREIDAVVDWVLGHDLDEPTLLLEQNQGSEARAPASCAACRTPRPASAPRSSPPPPTPSTPTPPQTPCTPRAPRTSTPSDSSPPRHRSTSTRPRSTRPPPPHWSAGCSSDIRRADLPRPSRRDTQDEGAVRAGRGREHRAA